jgi:hypothetical protein
MITSINEFKKYIRESFKIKDLEADNKQPLPLPDELFLNGEKYTGPAAFINGYNGYTSTDDDGLLKAFKNPNGDGYLTDKNGYLIRARNRRGQSVEIK